MKDKPDTVWVDEHGTMHFPPQPPRHLSYTLFKGLDPVPAGDRAALEARLREASSLAWDSDEFQTLATEALLQFIADEDILAAYRG